MTQPARDVEILKALQAVQTAIRGINGQNGYHFTIKHHSVTLDDQNLLLVHETKLPMVVIELTDTGERTFDPADMLEDRRVAALTWRLDAKGDSYDRKTIAFAQFEADLERALAADPTLGGLVVDCRLRQGMKMTGDMANDIVIGLNLLDLNCYRRYGEPEGL